MAITHPTGSEAYQAKLTKLGVPAPWNPAEEAGGLVAANGN